MIVPQQHASTELFVPDGLPRGSSLLIAEEGRFLVAARPPVVTHDRILTALTGVGGWVEEDESFPAAAQREAIEETGSPIRLLNLHQTLIVRAPDDIEALCLVSEVGPAALVLCRMGTRPFDPWSDTFEAVVGVAVYAGILTQRPRIVAPHEHPFFLWLYPEHLIALSDSELPLDYLLADGAELFGALEGDHARALVRLTDSIPALLTALGPRAFSFLGDIARLTHGAGLA